MTIRSLIKTFIPTNLFKQIEPYGHKLESFMWNVLYGFPGRGMKVIGITGTNGKTSTAFMVHKMLTSAGYKTGLMTTVAYGIDENIKSQVQHYTNVPAHELMKRLKFMKAAGIDWLVFEVTSQGLAQHRVDGVPFSVAVLTNITHEHLDYHGTFKNYVAAKKILFKKTAKYRNGLQVGIANADDPNGAIFAGVTPHPVLYGLNKADVVARDVKLSPTGSSFKAVAGSDSYDITSHIPGSFYVSNVLAAVCVGRAVGLSKPQIEQGIDALKGVEGRMTTIDEGQPYSVIVDFAHSPDSFEKLFKDMRPLIKGKLIVMFGSAGRRDEAKRAVQGEFAGKYADEVVITEEDDRDIDGMQILNEIADGAKKAGKKLNENMFLVHDRPEAIKFTFSRAQSGDTVLLLGKGHEKTIERSDGEHPWDEIKLAHSILKETMQK